MTKQEEINIDAKSYLYRLIKMDKLPRIEECVDVEEYAEMAQRAAEDEGLSLEYAERVYDAACEINRTNL